MDYNFVKVASAIPCVKVGNCKHNTSRIINLIKQAEKQFVDIVCFPELCITAYTCQDLFESTLLLDEVINSIDSIIEATKNMDVISIFGAPIRVGKFLANCAVAVQRGKILGIVPKTYLPNYKEFYERRWFATSDELQSDVINLLGQTVPVGRNLLFETKKTVWGIEICEDLWAPIPRSSLLALAGADVIFNLSADNECVGKYDYVKSLAVSQSAQTMSGYVFTSCGWGESTQDVVFAGNSFICENGKLLNHGTRFGLEEQLVVSEIDVEMLNHERCVNTTFRHCAQNSISYKDFVTIPTFGRQKESCGDLTRYINPLPFVPSKENLKSCCQDIINIQALGLAKRISHINAQTVVVGISGGLDSTLALLVCVRAYEMLKRDCKNIIGITMPGFGTSGKTYGNAMDLIRELGVSCREIPIKEACLQHFKDINHNPEIFDITYENSQARERTQILMDVANQTNGIVIGTGDLSELALGWATYNGDHMSMYGVNASIPKTLIRHLIKWFANNSTDSKQKHTLESIIDTPISPELIPTDEKGEIVQKTEDKVGPYELHDFFLYYTLRYGFSPRKIYFLSQKAFLNTDKPKYSKEDIKHWMKIFYFRFFQQQFKRSCLPDGPKVGSCSMSPRGDWRMPSDADYALWKEELEKL